MNLPPQSQNLASPQPRTARRLINLLLIYQHKAHGPRKVGRHMIHITPSVAVLPIKRNNSRTNASYWSGAYKICNPEGEDQIQGCNLKGNKKIFIKEEFPACQEAERVINLVSSVADKAPATCMYVLISTIELFTRARTSMYSADARRRLPGPPLASPPPILMSNAAPIEPPMNLTRVQSPVQVAKFRSSLFYVVGISWAGRVGLVRSHWAFGKGMS